MNRYLMHVCLAVLGCFVVLSWELVGSNVLEPLRVVLLQTVYRVAAVDVKKPDAPIGLAGVEIEELRARLAGIASVIPYRIHEGELRSSRGLDYATVLRIGRSRADLTELEKWFGALRQIGEGRCVELSHPGLSQAKVLKLDGRVCEVSAGQWNPVLMRLLSDRQRIGVVTLLDPAEAYFHPENQIYQALVLPGDRSVATQRRVEGVLASVELKRLGSLQHVLSVSSWRDQFWKSQKALLLLLMLLASATAISGMMAAMGLGLMQASEERQGDWIRRALGESRWRFVRRLLGFTMIRFFVLVALMSLMAVWGNDWRVCFWVGAFLAGMEWLGRILGGFRMDARSLVLLAVFLQVASLAGNLGLYVVQRENYAQSVSQARGYRVEGLSAWRVNLDLDALGAERSKFLLNQIYSKVSGRAGEAAYIYPLPMEKPLPVGVVAGRSSTARYFWTSREGVERLNLGCTDVSHVAEQQLRKGALISERLAMALFGTKDAAGAKFRMVLADYQVLGVCRDWAGAMFPNVFTFEPVNYAYLLLDEGLRPGGDLRGPHWELIGLPQKLDQYWIDLFITEALQVELIGMLSMTALVSSLVGLSWLVLFELRRRSAEAAIRVALGGGTIRVAWDLARGMMLCIVAANWIGVAAGVAIALVGQQIAGVSIIAICGAVLIAIGIECCLVMCGYAFATMRLGRA